MSAFLSAVQNEATLSFSRVDKFTRSSSWTHDCAPFEKEVMETISRKVSNIVRLIFTGLIQVSQVTDASQGPADLAGK